MEEDKVMKMHYNCKECKKYWNEHRAYWKNLGKEVPQTVLYCPACEKPIRRVRDW